MTSKLAAMQIQATNDHPTPMGILASARLVLGGIELDPASSAKNNDAVQADRYYTQADDGLKQPWVARSLFLNPPGSQRDDKTRGPSALVWFDKLVDCYQSGLVGSAIYIGYNAPENLGKRPLNLAKATAIIHSSTLAIPRSAEDGLTTNGRIKFRGDQPYFPSLICYYGANLSRFEKEFKRFGNRIFVEV
jgi:hypothetical protein